MKRIIVLFTLVTVIQILAFGATERIILRDKGLQDNRDPALTFDMPLAYYFYDNKTKDIIIDGGGVVSYYDVEISSPVTNTVEMTTQVNGTYDSFDISSLSTGPHVITIESPSGNIYEGTFTKY